VAPTTIAAAIPTKAASPSANPQRGDVTLYIEASQTHFAVIVKGNDSAVPRFVSLRNLSFRFANKDIPFAQLFEDILNADQVPVNACYYLVVEGSQPIVSQRCIDNNPVSSKRVRNSPDEVPWLIFPNRDFRPVIIELIAPNGERQPLLPCSLGDGQPACEVPYPLSSTP
jgi:hypothetical protein